MKSFSLRPARPDELHKLIAIDDAASELYAQAGLDLALTKDHPFVVAEAVRWAGAIEEGRAYVADDWQDEPIGFVTLRLVDGEPYVDQLAVHPHAMRRGIGAALLRQAIAWSADRALWLTTYAHLLWNKPYYRRHSFVSVPDSVCGAELRAILLEQRAALPDPDKRIAMVRAPSSECLFRTPTG